MKARKRVLTISIILNILFISALGYLINKIGGFAYLTNKAVAILSSSNNSQSTNSNIVYLKKQSQYELMPISEGSTVFIGDSITEGIEWSEVLHSLKYVNRGISSDTSNGVLNRLDSIIKSKPKNIFIMIGVNDLYSTGDTIELLSNYNRIIDRIQKNSPNTKIFIQSILPFNTKLYALAKQTKMSNEIIKDTNIKLNQLAQEKKVEFIDLYSLMATDNNELKSEYTFDGLHINGKAYIVWINAIKKYLD